MTLTYGEVPALAIFGLRRGDLLKLIRFALVAEILAHAIAFRHSGAFWARIACAELRSVITLREISTLTIVTRHSGRRDDAFILVRFALGERLALAVAELAW